MKQQAERVRPAGRMSPPSAGPQLKRKNKCQRSWVRRDTPRRKKPGPSKGRLTLRRLSCTPLHRNGRCQPSHLTFPTPCAYMCMCVRVCTRGWQGNDRAWFVSDVTICLVCEWCHNVLWMRATITVVGWSSTSVCVCVCVCVCVGPVAQSVWRLTTGWTVRDRIPVGTRFSARPDRPWGPPSLL